MHACSGSGTCIECTCIGPGPSGPQVQPLHVHTSGHSSRRLYCVSPACHCYRLTIDGTTHKFTSGVNVIKACAQAVGDSSLHNITGKGFKYTATPEQINAVRRERSSRGLSPAAANAATSAALDAAAAGGSAAPVAALRSRAAATTRRPAGAAVENGFGSAAVGVAAALMGSHASPAVSDVSQLDPCWLQHLENLVRLKVMCDTCHTAFDAACMAPLQTP